MKFIAETTKFWLSCATSFLLLVQKVNSEFFCIKFDRCRGKFSWYLKWEIIGKLTEVDNYNRSSWFHIPLFAKAKYSWKFSHRYFFGNEAHEQICDYKESRRWCQCLWHHHVIRWTQVAGFWSHFVKAASLLSFGETGFASLSPLGS